MRPLILAAMLCTLTAPAFAQERGSVELTLGDEVFAFPLWETQSDWSGSETYASVNIYARPTDDATWARFKTLTLGFEVVGGTASNGEISLTRMLDGAQQKLFGQDDIGDLTVIVDTITVEDDMLSLSGSFASELGTSGNFGRDIVLSDPLPVEGRFQVTLGPV